MQEGLWDGLWQSSSGKLWGAGKLDWSQGSLDGWLHRDSPPCLAVYPASTHASQTALAAMARIRIPQAKRKPRKRIRVWAMDRAFDSTPPCRSPSARGIGTSTPGWTTTGPWWCYAGKADNYRGLLVFAIFLICMRVLLHW